MGAAAPLPPPVRHAKRADLERASGVRRRQALQPSNFGYLGSTASARAELKADLRFSRGSIRFPVKTIPSAIGFRRKHGANVLFADGPFVYLEGPAGSRRLATRRTRPSSTRQRSSTRGYTATRPADRQTRLAQARAHAGLPRTGDCAGKSSRQTMRPAQLPSCGLQAGAASGSPSNAERPRQPLSCCGTGRPQARTPADAHSTDDKTFVCFRRCGHQEFASPAKFGKAFGLSSTPTISRRA